MRFIKKFFFHRVIVILLAFSFVGSMMCLIFGNDGCDTGFMLLIVSQALYLIAWVFLAETTIDV
jgi:hypothetical protein